MIMGSITLLIEVESKATWILLCFSLSIHYFRLKVSSNYIFKLIYDQTDMGYIIFNENVNQFC